MLFNGWGVGFVSFVGLDCMRVDRFVVHLWQYRMVSRLLGEDNSVELHDELSHRSKTTHSLNNVAP